MQRAMLALFQAKRGHAEISGVDVVVDPDVVGTD